MRSTAGRKTQRATDTQLGLFSAAGLPSVAKSRTKVIDRQAIEVELGIIAPETWPARYKVHKYWGRKPANIVGRYIQFFTNPGEVVLDPFAGSGVTVVEAARLQRQSVGFDLNPFAARLTNAMFSPPLPSAFEAAARRVVQLAEQAVAHLYVTSCDTCGGRATVRSIGYTGSEMREVRYRCPSCKRPGCHQPSVADISLAASAVEVPAGAPDDDIVFGWEMQKLKRRGIKRWSDLFTHRNYVAAAHLHRAILSTKDAACRNWLLLSLTASLAQFTRMIADFSGDAGGPSWKINCYWMPEKWQELNPLWYFENRVSKSLDSVRDLVANGAPFSLGKVENIDSRTMPLDDESVDYIFTDPPYGGEGIQYGELSVLWCLWLSERQDLTAEIAFNPYRKLDQDHYALGLRRVFLECYRVLRPGKWMTVTFANKDPIVWDALMNACRSAGFTLVTAAPMKRSAPSLTETTMHTAPKADLVLTFEKKAAESGTVATQVSQYDYSLDESVGRIFDALRLASPTVAPHDVYDRVTVDWFSWFYENGNRPNAIQPTLANVEAAMAALESRTALREYSELVMAPKRKKPGTEMVATS